MLLRLFAAALVLGLPERYQAHPASEENNGVVLQDSVLVLYDTGGDWGWVGGLHARLLGNLLGHFNLAPVFMPVASYETGALLRHEAAFYFGTIFDHPLPEIFLQDVLATTRPVCWFRYNLWQMTGGDSGLFAARFGFRYERIEPGGFAEVSYKGERFVKDQRDPELIRMTILNPLLAQARAVARQAGGTNEMPYILQSGRFWFVADSPFSYIGEEDRYVVFADLLHDILERDHPEVHRALIRLEDITPDYPTHLLSAAADLLQDEEVPFAIALIPVHEDPLGLFNQGLPGRVPLVDRPDFVRALQGMIRQGGQIVLHGYTHQYRDLPNPFTAVSADDYEFYRVTLDPDGAVALFEPVPEDSRAWVQGRVDAAREQLFQTGFSAVAWATPHYTASALGNEVFAANFVLTHQRVAYSDGEGHVASQFFPYPIERDIYGQRILPENLGNVMAAAGSNYPARPSSELIRIARKNRVVRDGWASAFFHPFLDPAELRALVQGIRGLGYTFVPLTGQVPPSICAQSPEQHHPPGATFELSATPCGSAPIQLQWQHNGSALHGATNASLRIENLQASQQGAYRMAAANDYGQTLSVPIHVRLLQSPRIDHLALTDGIVELWFESAEGLDYVAEYQDFLGADSWTATFPVTGTGGLIRINAPLGGLGQRFYRLRAQ